MNVAASASNCMQRRVRCLVIKSKKSAIEREREDERVRVAGKFNIQYVFNFPSSICVSASKAIANAVKQIKIKRNYANK